MRMSSTAQEFIECAAALLRDAADEPQFRAVCNRAYYGAFHAAQAFHRRLRAPGTVGRARGSHEQLIAQLCNPTINQRDEQFAASRAIGKSLQKLYYARVTADYHLSDHVDGPLAITSAHLAKTILRTTT